ncbi:MAG: hypothetical protein AAGH79_15940, partial [Bacteroidota bacterium]
MSEWDQLDDIFRDKLQHHDESAPMHIWDRIEQARMTQKKRGFGLFKWFSAVTLLLVVGTASAAWVYFSLVQETEKEATNLTSVDLEKTGETTGAWQYQVPAEETSSPRELISKDAINNGATQEVANIGTVFVPPSTGKTRTSLDNSIPEKAITLWNDQDQQQALVYENPQSIQDELATSSIKPGLVLVNPSSSENMVKQERDWQFLTAIATLNEPFDPDFALKKRLPDQKCHDFKIKLGWRWFVEATASSDFVIRSLVAKAPQNAYYAEQRNQTEKPKFSYTGGFRIGALFGKGWTARTGVQYAQINEDFNYNNSNEVRIVITDVYDNDGNIIGTDTTYESGQRTKLTHNRYRMIDIPVTVGYEFDLANFVFSLQGGAAFNVWFNQRGEFLSPELDPVDFSSGAVDPFPAFRKELGMSLIGSIGLHYCFHERARLIIEPHFRYYLEPFSTPDYMLKQ